MEMDMLIYFCIFLVLLCTGLTFLLVWINGKKEQLERQCVILHGHYQALQRQLQEIQKDL